MYDLVIIGGGPAGISAATMALNQKIETLIIAEQWGGQTTYTLEVEDGDSHSIMSGETLLDSFRCQLDYLDFVHHFDRVLEIEPSEGQFGVETARGDQFVGRTLILATGARPERLDVPGADRLAGRGLSHSATTHASLFLGKDVAVVGNGRRAQWATASLARKAHHVHLLAQETLVPTALGDKLRRMSNVTLVEGAEVREVLGERFVSGLVVRMPDGEIREIAAEGVFVKLTRTPNSGLVKDWVDCDSRGHILVDQYNATSWPGVFAAGDVTLVSEQVLVHVGDGIRAALSAYHHLLMR